MKIAALVTGLLLATAAVVTTPVAAAEDKGPEARPTELRAGGIELDLLTRRATRGELSLRLPEREAELLAHLMRHAGQVCSHEQILSSVWGYQHDPGTNVVQVYIGYLRRRLALPDSPAPIETVRSVGYRLLDEG